MDEVIQLLETFRAYRVSEHDILRWTFEKKSKAGRILLDLYAGRLSESDDVISAYYKDTENADQALQKLLYRLKQRLLKALIFIEPMVITSDYRQNYHLALQNWSTSRMLLIHSKRSLGIPIVERTYRIAKNYDFTDLLLLISKELRLHYGTIVGNKKKYAYYTDAYDRHSEDFLLESSLEAHYSELAINFVKSKSYGDALIQKAVDLHEKYKQNLKQIRTSRSFLYYYLIASYRYQLEGDMDQTLHVCDEAIGLFKSDQQESQIAEYTFQAQKLTCYVQLQSYQNGRITAERCLSLTPKGSVNWYISQNYLMLLCLRSKHYEAAMKVFMNAIGEKNFETQPEAIKESWKIYEAYLHFFIRIGKLRPTDEFITNTTRFKLAKFLNEVPIYSRDKRGMNIAIHIIQILFSLSMKRYDDVIDKIEAINQYCYRYLRRDDTFRSNCFIRMLLQIPISNFHKAGVLRRAEKYHQKLLGMPSKLANQPTEIEIVPYEELWRIAVSLLSSKFYHPRSSKRGKRRNVLNL